MKIEDTLVYAVKNKDKNVVKNSSSGGLFTALTDAFLNDGYAVASCIYNYETDGVEYKVYNDYLTRDSARGSKYIQASIGTGFKDLSEWLIRNPEKELIAFGTGCQMEGLRRFLELKHLRERVVIVDLICHGATSPGVWKKYLICKEIKGKIQYLSFKDKRNGWHDPTVYAKVEGKEVSIKDFSEWFYGGWAIRESCYKCPFAKIDRNSDITIGDYWGIEEAIPQFADQMGVSLALIHTEKGMELFNRIKEYIFYQESDKIHCKQPRLISPAVKPKDRNQFWFDIEKKGIEYCLSNYKERVAVIPFEKRLFLKIKLCLKKLKKDVSANNRKKQSV